MNAERQSRLENANRAAALLEAGRPITGDYANCMIWCYWARVTDFRRVEGRRPRYDRTPEAKESLRAYRDLTTGNNYGTNPEGRRMQELQDRIGKCIERQRAGEVHDVFNIRLGNCYHEAGCKTCDFIYRNDSSD